MTDQIRSIRNSLSYAGRIVMPSDPKQQARAFTRSRNGFVTLNLLLAEDHRRKKSWVERQAQYNPGFKALLLDQHVIDKGSDDYITASTSWHRVTAFGDEAEELAATPGVHYGALVNVHNVEYMEEGYWETRDGVKRAGRPETYGEESRLEIVFPPKDDEDAAFWDGFSEIPLTPSGGGNGGAPSYEGQGF